MRRSWRCWRSQSTRVLCLAFRFILQPQSHFITRKACRAGRPSRPREQTDGLDAWEHWVGLGRGTEEEIDKVRQELCYITQSGDNIRVTLNETKQNAMIWLARALPHTRDGATAGVCFILDCLELNISYYKYSSTVPRNMFFIQDGDYFAG